MRIHFLFPALVVCCFVLSCTSGNKHKEGIEHDIRMYHNAIRFGDQATAIVAMQSLTARDTSNTSYYDTLAVLYFQTRNFPQSIQAAQYVIEKNPNDEKMIEAVGRSYQALQRYDLSLPYFVRLSNGSSHNPEFDYQVAVNYFSVEQFDNAGKYAQKVIDNPQSSNIPMMINYESGQLKVPLIAAAYNILAMVKVQQGQKDEARPYFEKALEIAPDFTLAKENMQNAAGGKKDRKTK